MKFNDAYSQMFPGYPDAISLQQAAEMLGLNRHTVGELILSLIHIYSAQAGRTPRACCIVANQVQLAVPGLSLIHICSRMRTAVIWLIWQATITEK